MNNNSKEQMTRDMICKSHSARTERELYRICPSKLSKGELEDLYFTLLENNLDLKRTINSQREKIKELSTKLQRMSASQRSTFSKEQRECCLTIKAAYNEQKEVIEDLKRTNERMTERIKLLNMRLCSAKQFLKRSPAQVTPRCTKCFIGLASTPKNLSVSTLLNTKASDSNIKSKAVSTQTVDNNLGEADNAEDAPAINLAYISKNAVEESVCDENKCRTVTEELKQKIVNLELELSHCHEEYRERIERLEGEVTNLRVDKNRTNTLNEQSARTDQLTKRLREADTNNRELVTQLAIERRKVAEMEMRLKAAQISSRLVDTIKLHLAKADVENTSSPPLLRITEPSSTDEDNLLKAVVKNKTKEQFGDQNPESKQVSYKVVCKTQVNHDEQSKNLDDSGYADGAKSNDTEDDKVIGASLNQQLMKKIESLQAKFDNLKIPNLPAGSSIPPVTKPLGNITELEHSDKLPKADDAAGPEQLKEVPKSTPDMMKDSTTQDDNKNDSLPTILQQVSLQHHHIDSDVPHKSWDNTWGQYSVVLPKTSRELTENAYIFSGMYSTSEQNARDVASIVDKDTDDNKNDKYDIPEPLLTKDQHIGKEHKKSNFRPQSYAKDKDAHIELKAIDETLPQIDLTAADHGIIYSKGIKLSFEDEHVNFGKNKAGLLVPSAESISLADNNDILKTNSIEINRQHLTRDSRDNESVTPLKPLKNGKTEVDDSAVVKNNFIADYCTEDGNSGTGHVVESEQEGGVKYFEGTMTSGLRPLLTNRGPVISEKQSVGLIFADTEIPRNLAHYVKPGNVTYQDKKKIKSTDKSDKFHSTKGTNEFGVQATSRPVEQYAPYRRSTVNLQTQTYTLQHSDGDKSKDNDRDTDCEISELTDLPTELEEKSPREYLSPGEEKGTSTLSDSRTGDTIDFSSLSEGELPGLATIPRKLSEGERPADDSSQHGQNQTSAQKMESALQAITAELAKCKQLLLHQRRQQREVPVLRTNVDL